jgi:hypothetical protein
MLPPVRRPRRYLGLRGLAIAACAALATTAAPAQAEDDTQAWGALLANGAVKDDVFLWLEAQGRATDDMGGGSQFIVRPAIGARIARDAHAVVGYAYVRTDPENGRTTNEHRIWQQVQFVPLRNEAGAPRVISRTRLEQRLFEGRSDTGWRVRQLVRFQTPIAKQGAIQAIVFAEGFVNLNSTSWGARDGVDQIRTFVGVGLPVRPGMRLEPGYMNQHVFRRGEDRTNHILSATLVMAL